MSDYLNKIKESRETVLWVESSLHSLSQSFRQTGNSFLSMKLDDLASELERAINDIDNAVSANVNEQLEIAHQSTNNMINACLAMGAIEGEQL